MNIHKDEVRLYVYRHAEATKNLNEHLVAGRSHTSRLTSRGRAQGEELGDFIDAEREFDAVCSSIAVRAVQTTTLALKRANIELPVHPEPDLQEISQGMWEGKDRRVPIKIREQEEYYTHPRDRGLDGRVTGGESVREVGERVANALATRALRGTERRIMVVTHDMALRCLAVHLTGDSNHIKTRFPYCSETIVTFSSDALYLDEDHLGVPTLR